MIHQLSPHLLAIISRNLENESENHIGIYRQSLVKTSYEIQVNTTLSAINALSSYYLG